MHFSGWDMKHANQLDTWMEQEHRQKQRLKQGVGPGVNQVEQIISRSGLEIMQAILDGKLHYPPIAETLDFFLIEIADGRAVFQGTPGHAHLNPMGSIHGGWFATLLDSAMACAIQTRIPAGRAYTTTELSINLVRALTPDIKRVRAEGTVLHCGRQLATAEGKLLGPDGRLYAHGTTTCLVYQLNQS